MTTPLRLFASFFLCAWVLTGATRAADTPAGMATAIFAGGCFWCMERPFDDQPAHAALAQKRPDWARDKPGCSALSCSS